MAANPVIIVRGLKEFRQACAVLQDTKDFREAMKRVAQRVVDEATDSVPEVKGVARSSYKARAAGAGARVVFGGTKAPYVPWLEFGGRKHGPLKGKTTGRTQPIDRERVVGGRYLYPAIWRNQEETEIQVLKEINVLIKRYGFDATQVEKDPAKDLFTFMKKRGAR